MSDFNAENHLRTVIIPYWNSLRDNENGGFYGFKGFDLAVDKRAPKGVILHSRILWFYSTAYMTLKDPELRANADHAFAFLKDSCFDRENGGLFWLMNYDGTPRDTVKNTYNQAFGIYALSAYYRATGNRESLRLAYSLFECIEAYCTDRYGYLEAFGQDWKQPVESAICDQGVEAEKTMNTLLHVLEGYTGLLKADGGRAVAASLSRILSIAADDVFNGGWDRLETFFSRDMKPLADIHSYGHDIEASWLLDRAADVLEEAVKAGVLHDDRDDKAALEAVAKTRAYTEKLSRKILQVGYDGEALCNESRGEAAGKPAVDDQRVWWVQAEAVVGFINAWQKTGDEGYRAAAERIYRYINEVQVDKRTGSEWFAQVTKAGEPVQNPITDPWKCPYHNGRMCLELIARGI